MFRSHSLSRALSLLIFLVNFRPKISRVLIVATALCYSITGYSLSQSPKFKSEPVDTGVYNELYEYNIETAGSGNLTTEIILSSGKPPAGVILEDLGNRTAKLFGVPQETGAFPIELTVRDVADPSNADTQAFELNISKATALVYLSDLTTVYTGNPVIVTALTDPEDLDLEITYDGVSDPPADAGDYKVLAEVQDINYKGSASSDLSIAKSEAKVTLSDLTQTYTGNPLVPTATTDPEGLDVDFTFNGSSERPVNAGTYEVTATVDDPNYEGSASGTFTITKASASVVLSDLNKPYNGNPQAPSVTTEPENLNVDLTFNGSSEKPVNTGTYEVTATINDTNYKGTATNNFTISKGTATVILSDLNKPYNGNPQSPTVKTEPEGLSYTITFDGSEEAPSAVGNYAVEVIINDTNYEGSANETFTISNSEATITLSAMTQTYTGSQLLPTATTDPPDLAVKFTFDGVSTAPTNAGSYALVATIDDPDYSGSASGTFKIEKAEAKITLTDLNKKYTGSPQSPTVTTEPQGLSYNITYNGSEEEPTAVGSYAVEVTITDPNHQGFASGTFTISSNEGSVTLTEMVQTYTGDPLEPKATTDPPNLKVNFTFDGSANRPTNAGSYEVVATIDDPDYSGSATGTFVIEKAAATIEFSDLNKTYTGNPQSPTVTTVPNGLSFDLTFNGSPEEPSAEGEYTVVATITDTNYSGTASAVFVISAATTEANIILSEMQTTYTGSPQSPTVTTDPPDLNVDLTFDGSSTPPTNAGSYFVEANINEPEYSGSASGTFIIKSAEADIAIAGLNQNFDGTPKAVSVTTDPVGIDVKITYSGSANAPTEPGSYLVKVSIADNNYTGSASGTLIINGPPTTSEISDVVVNEDAATYKINLKQYFDDVEDTDDQLNYSVENNTNAALFSSTMVNDSKVLLLAFAADMNGSAHITVRATDTQGLYVDDQFSVTINAVQDDPYFITTPVKGILQGERYTYNAEAADPDQNDVLTYNKIFAPDWLTFTDNGDGKGVLTGVPGFDDVGNHTISLEVKDDHGNSATQSFTIRVVQSNAPPFFTSTPIREVNQDQLYRYNVKAEDPNGDEIAITASALPGWLTLTASGNGEANLKGTPANENTGDHEIVLRVTDIFGSFEEQSFTITVHNINDAPTFVSEPITRASLNNIYSYEIKTADIDKEDTRTISATELPDWLNLEDQGNGTAYLSGTAPAESPGSKYNLALVVKDEHEAHSRQNFTLTVNTPPEIQDISILIKEDSIWQVNLGAIIAGYSDQEGDEVMKIKVETLPGIGAKLMWRGEPVTPGIEIPVTDNQIQALKYIPPQDESGTDVFQWSAYDGYDWSEKQANASIRIEPVNDKPVLSNLESTPLAYSQRDPGVAITQTAIINDVDNSHMTGATVKIHEGYVQGKDMLSYNNAMNANISGEFDRAEGLMILSGEDTRSNYEIALSNILFSSTEIGETAIIEKAIRFTVTDGVDSSEPVERTVRIAEVLPDLDIVNAFTPNNDAVNDLWDFVNLEFYSSIDIKVYDQDGTSVFNCSEIDCTWDGTSNGKELPAGQYFYTINLNDGKRKYKGIVNILK